MRIHAAVALLLSTVLAHAAEDGAHDGAHGKGGCDSFPWEMNREWAFMITDPIPFPSSTERAEDARYMPMDRRVHVKLHPADKVKLAAAPEKSFDGPTYAGMAPMRVPFGRRYRISTTTPVWVDVVGPAGPVAAGKFAMALDCDKLVKTVMFKLDIETEYWLQITGSREDNVDVVVTLDR